jgi:hypothetical protein
MEYRGLQVMRWVKSGLVSPEGACEMLGLPLPADLVQGRQVEIERLANVLRTQRASEVAR